MKLRRIYTEEGPQVEALKPGTTDAWVRLSNLKLEDKSLTSNLLRVLELGRAGWQRLEEALDAYTDDIDTAAEVQLMRPFDPLSFRDFLLFEQHFIDASRGFVKRFLPQKYKYLALYERIMKKTHPKLKPPAIWYEQPLYYFGNHLNFLTDDEDIEYPSHTKALDYELELGAILAEPLLDATPKEATDAIGGYVVLNDLSARDVQVPEMQSGFGPQKAKHFQNAMSAIVVTADEINQNINHLKASVTLNGLKTIPCTTEHMQYSLGEAIAHASKSEQLYAGELFGSGTLPGGSGMENGCWLQQGSVLSLKIDAIADLTNRVL